MADGNFLTAIGVDLSLITSGAAGGLLKAIVDRTKPLEAVGAMVAGAIMSNYFAASAVELCANGVAFGFKFQVREGVAGCFLGAFSFMIFGWAGTKLRARFGKETPP